MTASSATVTLADELRAAVVEKKLGKGGELLGRKLRHPPGALGHLSPTTTPSSVPLMPFRGFVTTLSGPWSWSLQCEDRRSGRKRQHAEEPRDWSFTAHEDLSRHHTTVSFHGFQVVCPLFRLVCLAQVSDFLKLVPPA